MIEKIVIEKIVIKKIAIKKLIVIKLILLKKLILIKKFVKKEFIAKHKNSLLNPQPSNDTQDGPPNQRPFLYDKRVHLTLSDLKEKHKTSLLNPQPSNDAQDGPQQGDSPRPSLRPEGAQELTPPKGDGYCHKRNQLTTTAQMGTITGHNSLVPKKCTTVIKRLHRSQTPSSELLDPKLFMEYNLIICNLPRIFHNREHPKKWRDFFKRLPLPPPDRPAEARKVPPNRAPHLPITSRSRSEVADTHNDHPPVTLRA